MAKYTVEAPDGKRVTFEWDDPNPPTDADMEEVFAASKVESPKPTDAADMNVVQKFLAGAGGGMQLLAKGVEQIPSKLLLTDTSKKEQLEQEGEEIRRDLARLKAQSTSAKVGEFVGEALPGMVVPGGVTGGALKRAATAALAGAGQGAVRFTGEGEDTSSNVLAGALGGAVGSLGMSAAGKALNVVTGKYTKPLARELGERFDIPTTLGEEISNPHVVRAETWMERIPLLGIKSFREKQHKATEQAAKGFMAKYVRNPEEVRGALDANRGYVDSLYEGVKTRLSGFKELKAYVGETSKTARELLDRYPDTFKQIPDAKVAKLVTDIKTGTGKIHYIDDLWELRKGIGGMLGQAKKKLQSGEVNETQYSMLSKLYASVSQDMDKFANQIGKPEIRTAFQEANNAYKKYVVKYSLIERAFDKAAGAEGAGKVFSPQRFSNELNRILVKDKYYGSFTELEKKEMAGLANILSIVKRAGQYAENPPTGARLAEPGAVMAAVGFAKTVPYAVMAKALSTSKAGKALVLAASKVEPESAAMKAIINQAYKLAARMSASGTIDLVEIDPEWKKDL